jgi:phosphoribosylpyrophosphate synthetase
VIASDTVEIEPPGQVTFRAVTIAPLIAEAIRHLHVTRPW